MIWTKRPAFDLSKIGVLVQIKLMICSVKTNERESEKKKKWFWSGSN